MLGAGVPAASAHHETGLISAQVWGRAALSHVGLLRCGDVLLLLLDPVRSNLEHQALQQVKILSIFPVEPLTESAEKKESLHSHLQMVPTT